MDKIYLNTLIDLEKISNELGYTPLATKSKIYSLIKLTMQVEKMQMNRNLEDHPYLRTRNYILDAINELNGWKEVIPYIEMTKAELVKTFKRSITEKHEVLFQKLWVNYSAEDYDKRIQDYNYRLKINRLADGQLDGAVCVDFGCGHGNFAHALIHAGAKRVEGIDIGPMNIEYAKRAAEDHGLEDKLNFTEGSATKVSFQDNTFDFAIQNGVFHHLPDEDLAYKEIYRVLKPGGKMWVYTQGEGDIMRDIWDSCVRIFDDNPEEFLINEFKLLNIQTNKIYHLSDGMNANYRKTTWNKIVEQLSKIGFYDFERIQGGMPYDFDHDVIEADPFGKEKFGEGDLRFLCQK